jgi:hypothetical protein
MSRARHRFSNKILFVLFSGTLIFLPCITLAQDTPCEGDDPFGAPCPFDTWVWVLVITASVFGAMYLYRQQKRVDIK